MWSYMPPMLAAGRSGRYRNLARLHGDRRAATQRRGRDAEGAPEGRGEMAVAREAHVDPDSGDIARAREYFVERGAQPRVQMVAMHRHPRDLAEQAREPER